MRILLCFIEPGKAKELPVPTKDRALFSLRSRSANYSCLALSGGIALTVAALSGMTFFIMKDETLHNMLPDLPYPMADSRYLGYFTTVSAAGLGAMLCVWCLRQKNYLSESKKSIVETAVACEDFSDTNQCYNDHK